jgi:ATP-dependent DNA helicase RecQ
VLAGGYSQLKTYGVGKDVSFMDWRDYIIQLANQGLIEIMYSEGSALKISSIGWKVLKGEQAIKLTLPVIPEEKNRVNPKAMKMVDEGEVNTDLYDELKKLRFSIAREKNVPAYVIFSDKVLKLMATDMPVTTNQFLAISGVGMNKTDQYGEEFMQVIRQFKAVAKPKKIPTALETFVLYKEGLNPEEIAAKRALQLTTIYSHLSQLYTEGKDIELEKLVAKAVVDKVRVVFNELNREIALKPIFERLNEAVSYEEIRMSLTIILKNE